MYLFLFVYVAQEINETTNKGHYSQAERDPSQRMTAARFRKGHKPVEVIDRADGGHNSHHYRENILQAFHFEPPPNDLIMKVKEKAETVANNGCMLTPGMRECKSDVYMKFLSEFKQSDSGTALQGDALFNGV